MIFVCVGSRDYQFNRLLIELDKVVSLGEVNDKIVAQIGQSDYEPKNFEWYRYMERDTFKEYQQEAELIISHGGTGALIGALKLNKQVIAVPRLEKFGEHIDDHQTQVSGVLEKQGYLRMVIEIEKLSETIRLAKTNPITKQYDIPSKVVNIVEEFIEENSR